MIQNARKTHFVFKCKNQFEKHKKHKYKMSKIVWKIALNDKQI